MKILEFIKTTLIYIVFPPMCPVCKEIVDERGQLCDKCIGKVFKLDTIKFLPDDLSGVMRITEYRGGTQKLLGRLKFHNDLSVLPALQRMLNQISHRPEVKEFLTQIDLATFVPLHEKRLKERGYNQTELLFKDWLTAQNVRAETLLVRHKATPKLFDFNPAERKMILQDAFSTAPDIDLIGKNILIVDDIYTTGATTSECARVLKDIGAAEIYVLAFASDFGR